MSSMKARKPEPAEIEHKNMRFLITDRPNDANMDKYVEVRTITEIYFEIFSCLYSGLVHGLSQQGVWTPFWTPPHLKKNPSEHPNFSSVEFLKISISGL